MPIVIRKMRNKECWKVFNKDTGEVHAKCTTKAKAEAQKRLIDKYNDVENKDTIEDIDELIEDVVDNTKAIITIIKKKKKSFEINDVTRVNIGKYLTIEIRPYSKKYLKHNIIEI